MIRNLLLWFAIWGIFIFLQALFADEFAWHSAIIALVTYSAFAVILCVPSSYLGNLLLQHRIMRWIRWVVLIEAILGIVQAVYGYTQSGSFDLANGDFVEGTIHPWLESELSFSNPMFAANMTLMLLALLPMLIIERKGGFVVVIGTISLVLASVVHVLMFIAASLFISVLIFRPLVLKEKMVRLVIVGAVLASILSVLVLRSNIATLRAYTQMLITGDSYRSQVVLRAVTEMPDEYPVLPLVGIGPGQFSSRAGLIGTGMYFGSPANPKSIPLMPTGMSEAFENYVLDLWLTVTEIEQQGVSLGSTHQPFFSWLSVYVEMGLIGIGLVLGIAGYSLWRLKKAAQGFAASIRATAVGASIIFILLLGIQENYWEIPQALLVGLMLIQLQYGVIVGSTRVENEQRHQLPVTNDTA